MEWVYPESGPGDPLGSHIVRCPVCGAGKQQEYLERICGLSGEMREWQFDNGTTRRTRGNADAFDAAKRLAQSPAWFLTLHGSYGTGKTRLLACLVNGGRMAGWTSVYMTSAELFDHLRRAYAPTATISFDGLWDKITNARILALDELDRFNPTAWAQEKFFELVDIRYRLGPDHLTAFATNAELEELPGYLASRLRDRRSVVCEMTGTDLRQLA